MKITLNHFCHMRGAAGIPGEVIDAPDKLAKILIARGGATRVTAPAKKQVAAVNANKKAIALAERLGVELADVTGSGGNGVITEKDVQLHADLTTEADTQ